VGCHGSVTRALAAEARGHEFDFGDGSHVITFQ